MIGMPKIIRQHDGVCVILDILTKAAHFLHIKATLTSEQLASLYIKEIVRLHGVPLSIVSDHDTKLYPTSGMVFKGQWAQNYD